MRNEKLLINNPKSNNSEVMRNKQIEEMAECLIDIQRKFNEYCAKPCRTCELGGIVNCENHYKAEALYNAGYRKQSEVVKEFAKLFEKYIGNCTFTLGQVYDIQYALKKATEEMKGGAE